MAQFEVLFRNFLKDVRKTTKILSQGTQFADGTYSNKKHESYQLDWDVLGFYIGNTLRHVYRIPTHQYKSYICVTLTIYDGTGISLCKCWHSCIDPSTDY
jgi:hypothetical protein